MKTDESIFRWDKVKAQFLGLARTGLDGFLELWAAKIFLKMKIAGLVFLFLGCLNMNLPLAFSNDCPFKLKNADYFEWQLQNAEMVLVGVILGKPTYLQYFLPDGKSLKEKVYYFEVLRYLKSKTHCDISVISLVDKGTSMCCPEYLGHAKIGDTVLVYAKKIDPDGKFGNSLFTHYSIIAPKPEHQSLEMTNDEIQFLNDSEKWSKPNLKVNFEPKEKVEFVPKLASDSAQNSDSNFLKISLLANALLLILLSISAKKKHTKK